MLGSNHRANFTVAYVITSDGRDLFADMVLLSMLSVRMSNPGLRIAVVCDEASARAIKAAGHRLQEICDELIPVATPAGEPMFRNRWVKTQLCRHLPGDVLYLDSDTLVRAPLADLPGLVSEFGAVPNHNGATLQEQIWDEDWKVVEAMGWPSHFTAFVNGGMWFYKNGPRTNDFFQRWHDMWFDGFTADGRPRDQPSLNSALITTSVSVSLLPRAYNAQLAKTWDHSSQAIVWHFYTAKGTTNNAFARIVGEAANLSLDQLRRKVRQTISAPAPWADQSWFARMLAKRVERRGSAKYEEALWLGGLRMDALCYGVGRFRHKLTGKK